MTSNSLIHSPTTRGRRGLGISITVFALVMSGSAFSATRAVTGASASTVQIREVQNVTTGLFAAASYAQQLGLYKKYGLDVQQIVTPGLIPELIASGQADIAIAGNPATYAAIVKGLPARLIAIASNGYGFTIGVSAKSDITSIAGLKGKTMGITSVGSASDYVTQKLSAKVGGFKIAPTGNIAALASALQNGAIDGFMFEPAGIVPLQEKGQVRILGSAEKFLGPGVAGAGVGIVVSSSFLQAHPAAVKNYLKAYFQAQRLLLDNSSKALLYLTQMLNVSVHTAGSAYSVYRGIWSRNGEPAKGTIVGTSAALTFIDPTITTPPPSSAYFDRQFLPANGK